MKVLQVHNFYQQAGGEDNVCRTERELLTDGGHEVHLFARTNSTIRTNGIWTNMQLAAQAIWSDGSYRDLLSLLRDQRPDIVHFHNTFPLISPAAYYACRTAGVPVVQTLHNYRLLCPAATLFRDGGICEDCSKSGLWQSVRHSCYRDSKKATIVSAAMLAFHRVRGTWTHAVDCYIALTEFSRAKFVAQGWPAAKLVVKPNFVHPDPGARHATGTCALFVGRLSIEKGILTLLKAWQQLPVSVPLRIVGSGPLRDHAERMVSGCHSISFVGQLERGAVLREMANARFLVFPSEWYECFPVTIAEALACGIPVIASNLGAMQEIIENGRTGLHFTPGDADDLAAKVAWAWEHPEEMAVMGRNARAEYEAKYTAERNYEMLMSIYNGVLRGKNVDAAETDPIDAGVQR